MKYKAYLYYSKRDKHKYYKKNIYIYNGEEICNKMENEDLSYINIIYDINKDDKDEDEYEYHIFGFEDKDKVGDEINIFGHEFVKNNKNKCKMIIDNKEYEITEKYNIENYNNDKLNIKLKVN